LATIENKSRTEIYVPRKDDLTKRFPHTKSDAAAAYLAELEAAGYKPQLRVLDEAYLVRFKVNGKRCSFTTTSAAEAERSKKRIEANQESKLFIDYTESHQTTFADLLIRYLKEEAPRTKGYCARPWNTARLWMGVKRG